MIGSTTKSGVSEEMRLRSMSSMCVWDRVSCRHPHFVRYAHGAHGGFAGFIVHARKPWISWVMVHGRAEGAAV